jgi:hypothetical protein
MPEPIKPSIPIDKGTIPNSNAPTRKALPILSFLTQNALCQKHWSPNGPEISPIVVGSPNPKKISHPLFENSDPASPVAPPKPITSVSNPPPFFTPKVAKPMLTANMKTIWIASVSIDAFIPENCEYENAIAAIIIVMTANGIPVSILNILLPANSCTPVDNADNAPS